MTLGYQGLSSLEFVRRIAAREACLCMAGVDRKGLIIAGECRVPAVQFAERMAAVEVGFGLAGIDGDGSFLYFRDIRSSILRVNDRNIAAGAAVPPRRLRG